MVLKEFKELELSGDERSLAVFVDKVTENCATGWRRARDLEERIDKSGTLSCFACEGSGARPAASLWLASHSPDRIYVSNIVPLNKNELSYDEYNAVLDDFRTRLAAPAAAALRIEITTTDGVLLLERLLSETTLESLKY